MQFGVHDSSAVIAENLSGDNHGAIHDHWAALSEWLTVRGDIRLLRKAVQRAGDRADDAP